MDVLGCDWWSFGGFGVSRKGWGPPHPCTFLGASNHRPTSRFGVSTPASNVGHRHRGVQHLQEVKQHAVWGNQCNLSACMLCKCNMAMADMQDMLGKQESSQKAIWKQGIGRNQVKIEQSVGRRVPSVQRWTLEHSAANTLQAGNITKAICKVTNPTPKHASKLLQISDAEHAIKVIGCKRDENQTRKKVRKQAAVGSRRWTLEWPASYIGHWDSKRPMRRDGNCRKKCMQS